MPYAASWFDRWSAWVRRLPIPAWMFYLAISLSLSAFVIVLGSSSGLSLTGSVVFADILACATSVYLAALLHYLDDWAGAELKRFRPLLSVDDAAYTRLLYRLTTLPRGRTLAATVVGALYAVAGLLTFGLSSSLVTLGGATSPLRIALLSVFFFMSYTLTAVAIYHTIHQLRLVNEIYTSHTRINLFRPGPLYAWSRLAASTAIGLGLPTYLWLEVNSSASSGDIARGLSEATFFTVIIVLTFFWPLLGAHRLLAREKERLADEAAQRIESTIAELHQRIDKGQLDDRSVLKGTLDGLAAEQAMIDKLPTWPWQPRTVSGLGLAILLPMMIWLIQRLLQRLGI